MVCSAYPAMALMACPGRACPLEEPASAFVCAEQRVDRRGPWSAEPISDLHRAVLNTPSSSSRSVKGDEPLLACPASPRCSRRVPAPPPPGGLANCSSSAYPFSAPPVPGRTSPAHPRRCDSTFRAKPSTGLDGCGRKDGGGAATMGRVRGP